MHDIRIWEPDETCQPLLWETSIAIAGGSCGSFKVPADDIGVIYAYHIIGPSSVEKATARFNIVPDRVSGTPLRVNGSLVEVTELSSTLVNNPGLAIMPFTGPRPCRIILEGGRLYFVVQTGNPGAIVGVTLCGYSFRPHS